MSSLGPLRSEPSLVAFSSACAARAGQHRDRASTTVKSCLVHTVPRSRPGPGHQIRKRMFLPAVPNFPQPCVRLRDGAIAESGQIGDELFLIFRPQVVEPVVAEIGVSASTSSPYTSF